MSKINTLIILLIYLSSVSMAQSPNCVMEVSLDNVEKLNRLYFNNGDYKFFFDSLMVADGCDTVLLHLTEPKYFTLFINNDAERYYNFYLYEGSFQMEIDCNTKNVKIKNSPLNDEYKEMMHVHDSLYTLYNIMHYMLYPYNGTNRDTARAWLQKYGPFCDSLSDIHIRNFYEMHQNSFLTLENIYIELSYTFEDPGYDTILYNKEKLRQRFDKLGSDLKKYKMYNDCLELFNKEYPKLSEPAKSLFQIEEH